MASNGEASSASIGKWLLGAAVAGTVVGTASIAVTEQGRTALIQWVKPAAVGLGIMRQRPPQPGDYWPGCNPARKAGTAPIYRGEPGYRPEMDCDNDGIACEPQR